MQPFSHHHRYRHDRLDGNHAWAGPSFISSSAIAALPYREFVVRLSIVIGKLTVNLLVFALLAGCSGTGPPDDTSTSKLYGESGQSGQSRYPVGKISDPQTLQGELCYHINQSEELVFNNGEFAGIIRNQNFDYGPWCVNETWHLDKLNEIRSGEFRFPFGILSDLETRRNILAGADFWRLRKGVALLIMELHRKGHNLSDDVGIEYTVNFCENPSQTTCGNNSWEENSTA